jgi:hypothetical protein
MPNKCATLNCWNEGIFTRTNPLTGKTVLICISCRDKQDPNPLNDLFRSKGVRTRPKVLN